MRLSMRNRCVVGTLVTLASIGLVGVGGAVLNPAAATTFAGVQCHGTLNGAPLPDSLIGTRSVTVNLVQPSSVSPGTQFTVTIKGNTATLPASQSGLTITNFTNLSNTYRVDGATFVSGSAVASGQSKIDGTPITGSITLGTNTMKAATPGPIHPGTLVTPDITVKVKAGAAGSVATLHAVTLMTTAHLGSPVPAPGLAPLTCPLPDTAVGTTNVVASCAAHDGYWLVGGDGGVFSFGTAQFYGSTGGRSLTKPVVGIASAASGAGYWFVASDGGVFSFGPDAKFFGSMGGTVLNKPVVAIAGTASGKGYWLAASDGGIFSFGDAKFFGSMGGTVLNQPVVAMAATPSGKGYWLATSDGGIFSFGDAKFYGSLGGTALNKPVVGLTTTSSGKGYWLATSDGGIFSFGDAAFLGSVGPTALTAPAVAIHNTVTDGYRVAGEDGHVNAFHAPSCGSVSGLNLAAPIVAIEAVKQQI